MRSIEGDRLERIRWFIPEPRKLHLTGNGPATVRQINATSPEVVGKAVSPLSPHLQTFQSGVESEACLQLRGDDDAGWRWSDIRDAI